MGIVEESSETPSDSKDSGETGQRTRRVRTGPRRRELRDRIEVLSWHRRVLGVAASVLGILSIGLGAGWFGSNESLHLTEVSLSIRVRDLERQLQVFKEEAETAREESQTAREEAQTAKQNLSLAEERLGAIVSDRIPSLVRLEMDRPIDIGHPLVREISFHQVAGPDQTRIESRVVVENTQSKRVGIALEAQLFDEVGVQVGRSVPLSPNSDMQTLRPGEIRTFFLTFESRLGLTPTYFRITQTD
jgi:outer membrane murein-binding lipoprotein Lpp